MLELEFAVPRLVFPVALLVMVLTGVEALRPAFDEELSVLTVPLELEDVRPEVLCAAEPELELLDPCM